jgi:hypothetical protein
VDQTDIRRIAWKIPSSKWDGLKLDFVGTMDKLPDCCFCDERLTLFRFLNDGVKNQLFATYYEDQFIPKIVSPWPYLQLNERYSACALTYDKDKIVAMTGMVYSIQQRHNVHFNAGIWLTFPIQSLLWGRKKSVRLRRLEAFDFPSWTWVAYDGEVEFLSGNDGFEPRHDLKMSIMEGDGVSAPFMSPMTLFGPVAPLNPDLRIDKGELEIKYARPRAIKNSAGESIGCAMFDDPDDDGDGVECLIVETRPDDDGQQKLPPRPAPGKDISVTIKVKRGYVTGLIGDLCNSDEVQSSIFFRRNRRVVYSY